MATGPAAMIVVLRSPPGLVETGLRDRRNAIPLAVEDSMVSSLDVQPTREDRWDRSASVLGFWGWRDIGLSRSSGKWTARELGCASGSSARASADTPVRAVADGHGRCAMPHCGRGM